MKKNIKQYLATTIHSKIWRFKENFTTKNSFNPYRIILREKIERKIDGLFKLMYRPISTFHIDAYVSKEPLSFGEKENGKFVSNLKVGQVWADEVFDCGWFHLKGEIHNDYDFTKDNIVFLLDIGGEGLIYDNDGNPIQAITCSASGYDYTLGLPAKMVVMDFCKCQNPNFWIDGAANDLFGNLKNRAKLKQLSIAICRENIRQLAYDLQVLISIYDVNKNDDYVLDIFSFILTTFKNLNTSDELSVQNALKLIAPYLEKKNDTSQFNYFAVGHAHLDLAWLWPIRETKRKAARTFYSQLINISRYPNYVFGASQAQLYDWIKESYPNLYQKVQSAANTPQWDVQGATWVEMDSNLINGESLIRQFYYGKKFFKDEFNQDIKILWLPDSFGYSACLPQVMKLANVDYFLTQKLSWNTVNKFPYHTFKWSGLDGSTVLSHMLPDDTYNAPMRADKLIYGKNNYKEKAISNNAMMLFGIGDGGAGPGYEHIERLNRLSDLKGLPRVTPQKSLESFKILDAKIDYPIFSGELYLERHRGTYTTQSKNKFYNRRCEMLLRNCEMLMFLSKKAENDVPITCIELEKIWKEILLYQFHDILPGSSINRVYEESVARYEKIYATLNLKIYEMCHNLYGKGVFNFNSYDYEKTIKIGNHFYRGKLFALGFTPLKCLTRITEKTSLAGENFIENDNLKIIFENGYILSYYDKKLEKEFVKDGKRFAVFTAYKDIGDCWDIRPYDYHKTGKEATCQSFRTYVKNGCVYAEGTYLLNKNKINCIYSLCDFDVVMNMEITIDCVQKSSMIRCEFNTAIVADSCNFNLQFGHIERKTTENNSVEKAQFEVSAQKFVDLSQSEYGISLLNDCKYGYRCKDSVIDINLIRSPRGGPGKEVDQGENKIKLALFTHKGKLSSATYKQAYYLNNPPLSINGEYTRLDNMFENLNENLVIEGFRYKDNANELILHVYNSSSEFVSGDIKVDNYTATNLMDIMENSIGEPSFDFNGFELKIIKFVNNFASTEKIADDFNDHTEVFEKTVCEMKNSFLLGNNVT